MRKTIKTSHIFGKVNMPTSKSLLHRYLIIASRNSTTNLRINQLSKDSLVTIEVLKRLGANIEYDDSSVALSFNQDAFPDELDFGESGASFRFLLSYAFLTNRKISCVGSGRLPDRPIEPLLQQLEKNGVEFSNRRLPFIANGAISGSQFNFSGSESSQFISGIMLISPFLNDEIIININGDLKSKSYVDMTSSCMADFGVSPIIDKDYSRIVIPNKRYKNIKEFKVEGDWSNAIVPIALAILRGRVIISGLFENSIQGDSRLVTILKDQGADISWENGDLIVNKSQLKSFDLDIDDNIDLFPVLSVLAISCEGESIFRNISRLRLKESDRIESTLALHNSLSSRAYLRGDNFVVEGKKKLKVLNAIDSFNDHRIVMAATVASSLTGQLEVESYEAIEKSYPRFDKAMKDIGIDIR